ncbi:MAG: OB-fold domain, acyl-CoA-associated [Bryobacterales bacterium]|jgi:uncharacterized OB-fold protein|nr:OB-fold domain, acyl-CoA-associated [Bryobacterales bacterium]
MRTGTVYTETVVHAAAERFAAETPYQVIIVDLEGGGRLTARADGERVSIGDAVLETGTRDSVPHFRKS